MTSLTANQNNHWPPDYKIKTRRSAKYVRLKITRAEGLEITLPHHIKPAHIPHILEENKTWIKKQILKYPLLSSQLPDSIFFHSTNERWTIHYEKLIGNIRLIERPDQALILIGNIDNKLACKKKMIAWIKKKSVSYLHQQLSKMSELIQLPYKKLHVRQQKCRWGSCNKEQVIHLNFKLIFLPSTLIKHILIHELCHTKYLNHSEKFWRLVARYDLHWEQHKQALRHADQFMPDWL